VQVPLCPGPQGDARVPRKTTLEEGDPVPVDFEGARQPEAAAALGQLAVSSQSGCSWSCPTVRRQPRHRLPFVGRGLDLELRERKWQLGIMRRAHVGHAATKRSQPVSASTRGFPTASGPKSSTTRCGSARTAQLRHPEPVRRHPLVIHLLEQAPCNRCHPTRGLLQRHAVLERPDLAAREGRAGPDLSVVCTSCRADDPPRPAARRRDYSTSRSSSVIWTMCRPSRGGNIATSPIQTNSWDRPPQTRCR